MHHTFESIENHYRQGVLKRITTAGYHLKSKTEWDRFEKLDGANFSFICDGLDVTCGKRNFPLVKENFYEWEKVKKRYEHNVLSMFKDLKKIYKNLVQFNLFGELHGGMYPGFPAKTKPLNRNTYYSPSIQFMAFDLQVTLYGEEHSKYMIYDDYKDILDKHQIPYVKLKSRTTLEEALKFSPTFITEIPRIYGLEDIEGNIAEGVVLKPSKEVYIYRKDENGKMIPRRPIIKHKHTGTMEKKKSTYKKSLHDLYSEDIIALKDYLNEARLINVVTKMGGDVGLKDMTKVMRKFREDAFEEYYRSFPEDPKTTKPLNKVFGSIAASLVRDFLIEHEDLNKKLDEEIKKHTDEKIE
jgi:Rnl2 family RNA ligase